MNFCVSLAIDGKQVNHLFKSVFTASFNSTALVSIVCYFFIFLFSFYHTHVNIFFFFYRGNQGGIWKFKVSRYLTPHPSCWDIEYVFQNPHLLLSASMLVMQRWHFPESNHTRLLCVLAAALPSLWFVSVCSVPMKNTPHSLCS